MGAKGAVEIIYRKEAGDREKLAAHARTYEERFMSPFVAAERGYIDEVIMPHSTRRRIGRALRLLRGKGSPTRGRSTTIFRCERPCGDFVTIAFRI